MTESLICITNMVKGKKQSCGRLLMFDVTESRGFITTLASVAEFRDDIEDFIGALKKHTRYTIVVDLSKTSGKLIATFLNTWRDRVVKSGITFSVIETGTPEYTKLISGFRYAPIDLYEYMTLYRESKRR